MNVRKIAEIEICDGRFSGVSIMAVVSDELKVSDDATIVFEEWTNERYVLPVSVEGLNDTERVLDETIKNTVEYIKGKIELIKEIMRRGYEIRVVEVDDC